MASYSLVELARLVGGEVIGDASVEITGVAGIKEAHEGDITFLANPKYESYLATTQASAVIAAGNGGSPKPVIKVANPYLAFLKVMSLFTGETPGQRQLGVHPTATIAASASIGADVSIGAYCFVGENVRIGDRTTILPLVCLCDDAMVGADCLVYPHVTIRERCEIGDRVILHAGAVIGADGFGYAKDGDRYFKIPQVGNVILEDDVEVGANTAIDRGALGPTIVKQGTKIDNLVQIAHNVHIGKDGVVAGQSGVAGSTFIGDRVVMGGQVGIIGHLKIGDDVTFGAQSGVLKSIPSKTVASGYPAKKHTEARRREASVALLPNYIKKINAMEKRIVELEKRLKDK